MARDLTIKQQRFVAEYIDQDGNGTQAALRAYDTDDATVANAIAVENLRKPSIQAALQAALEAEGIGPPKVARVVYEALGADRTVTTEKGEVLELGPDHNIRLRAADFWAKLVGAFPAAKREVKHAHLHARLELASLPLRDRELLLAFLNRFKRLPKPEERGRIEEMLEEKGPDVT